MPTPYGAFLSKIAGHFGEVPDIDDRIGSLRGWVDRQATVLSLRHPGVDWEPVVWDAAYYACYTLTGGSLPRWAAQTLRWRVRQRLHSAKRRLAKTQVIGVGSEVLDAMPDQTPDAPEPRWLDGLTDVQAETVYVVAGLDGPGARNYGEAAHILGRRVNSVRDCYLRACDYIRDRLVG